MPRHSVRIVALLCAPLIWASAALGFDLRSVLDASELAVEAQSWRFADGGAAYGAALTLSDLDQPTGAPLLRGNVYVGGGGLSEAGQPAYIGADISAAVTLGPTILRPFLGASVHAAPKRDDILQGRAALGFSAEMGGAGALTLRADGGLDDAREAKIAISLGYGLAF